MLRIATSSYPHSSQRVQLGDALYTLTLHWSERAETWHLDLADADGDPIVSGIRLAEGVPLLVRYRHLGVPPGEMALIDTRGLDAEATLADMGTRFQLYYFAPGEL